MKPCPNKRKLIAWLAMGALEDREAAALRDHLAHCDGCRRYWQEFSNMATALASAAPNSDVKASETFYRRVANRLRESEPQPLLSTLAVWLRASLPSWRVALPVIGLLILGAFVAVALRQHHTSSLPSSQSLADPAAKNDPAPTLANYRMAACQSVDQLSELLSRQGNRPLPPAPVFTVSGLQLANGHF